MYQRILLAYDGSFEGAVALREGALLAKAAGARVFILSVVPEGGGVRIAEGVYPSAAAHQMDSYKEVLAKGVDRLTRLGLKPVSRLAMGDPIKAITAFAKEVNADLVVVGHQRRNMVERWWSGASGGYISDHVRCSILIARSHVSDEAFAVELAKVEGAAS